MTTINLDVLRVFAAVAELRSFTVAARRLGLDKSHVSRVVRNLEQQMGTPLLVRTTRNVRTTHEGAALYAKAAPALAVLEGALQRTAERVGTPLGEVTLTTTPDLARALVAPHLPTFRERYPGVRVKLVLAREILDMSEHDIDLALRVGTPGPGSHVAKKVGVIDAGFFAAPSYLARCGTPRALTALGEHETLWPAPSRERRVFAAHAPPASLQCDDFGLLAELARAGAGVALLPTYLAARDVALGHLRRVLSEVSLGRSPLYLVAPPGRLPRRVAVLRELLLTSLRDAFGG